MGLFAIGWTGVWWGVHPRRGLGLAQGLHRGARAVAEDLLAVRPGLPHSLRGRGPRRPGADPVRRAAVSPGLTVLVGTAVLLGLINVIFYQLLRAPTEMGQQAAGPDRGLPPLSLDRRGRAPQRAASAGEDAGAVRALPALCAGARLRE